MLCHRQGQTGHPTVQIFPSKVKSKRRSRPLHSTPEEGLAIGQGERSVLHIQLQLRTWLYCTVPAEKSQPTEGSTEQRNRPTTTAPKKKQCVRHAEEMENGDLSGEVVSWIFSCKAQRASIRGLTLSSVIKTKKSSESQLSQRSTRLNVSLQGL